MNENDPLYKRIGEVVRTVDFPIERGKIAEFARAMKDKTPLYFDQAVARDIGYADVPAPLTFTVAAAHYCGGDATDLVRQLGLDLSRVVHGEQRWEYHHKVVAGEKLKGTTRLTKVDARINKIGKTLRIVELETVFTAQDGSPLVTETMAMVELPV